MNTVYIPWTQREGDQPSSYKFLARTAAGNPLSLAPALERLVREADPGLRLRTPQTYSAVVDQSIVTERIMATLGALFGVLALMVASLGVFGVMAFQVSRRINELGLRMALGASRRQYCDAYRSGCCSDGRVRIPGWRRCRAHSDWFRPKHAFWPYAFRAWRICYGRDDSGSDRIDCGMAARAARIARRSYDRPAPRVSATSECTSRL